MQILFFSFAAVLMLVNGWTDAPNSIVTAVTTKALSVRQAIVLASLLNFLGTVAAGLLFPSVTETLFQLGGVGEAANPGAALAALSGGMFAAELYAVVAALFGLPTSESHGMMAGISGAMFALLGYIPASGMRSLEKIGIGLLLSTLPALVFGYCICCFWKHRVQNGNRKADRHFQSAECLFASAGAFLHGAQDGGKFAGILMLGQVYGGRGEIGEDFRVPIPILLLTASLISAGTLFGGKKMIRKLGVDLVALRPLGGASADGAAAAVLCLCTAFGLPVSTTHAKTCAMIGAGYKESGAVDRRVMKELFLAWILTFPVCFLLGAGFVFLSEAVLPGL